MSSAVISTSAALGRPFFDDDTEPEVGSLTSASRASLDRTAPSTSLRAGLGGCPYINLQIPEKQEAQGSPLARVQSAIKNRPSKILPARVTSASQLDIRPTPEMVSSGVSALDTLTGGLPRGCLTEICGPASSGRTTLLLAAVAAATRRGEFCAVVDASDALDPQSAAAAGVELERLLWVRCGEDSKDRASKDQSSDGCPISRAPFAREVGVSSQVALDFDRTGWKETGLKENGSRQSERRMEQVLRATDLLLESGGFGLIVLDLGDLPPQAARHIPLTTWFRFRRAVEYTPTILLAIEQHPIAGSCSSLLLQLGPPEEIAAERLAAERRKNAAHGASRGLAAGDDEALEGRQKINLSAQPELALLNPAHAQLLTGLNITAELIRSRLDRKPTRSVAFETKTAWAG